MLYADVMLCGMDLPSKQQHPHTHVIRGAHTYQIVCGFSMRCKCDLISTTYIQNAVCTGINAYIYACVMILLLSDVDRPSCKEADKAEKSANRFKVDCYKYIIYYT